MENQTPTSSTSGPAKWAAIGALGGAAAIGLMWTLSTGRQPMRDPPAPTPRPGAPATSAPAEQPRPPGKLNLNTATKSQLEDLPHVGPSLAAAIIAYRNAHGPFRLPSDLDKVPGIGPKMVEQLRPLVTTD